MFRLQRYFSLASLAAFIVVTLVLSWYFRQAAIADLMAVGERGNIALTQAFANSLWPRFASYVAAAQGQDGDALRSRPETSEIRQAVLTLMRDTSVVKVKVYNLNGLTVFSTELAQIGEDKSGNAGYQKALQGGVASELTHRDTFSAFEGQIENRDVLASYIPIRQGESIEGVFEVYTDVTPLLSQVENSQRSVVLLTVAVLLLLYAALYLIVRRADGMIQQQYHSLQQAQSDALQLKESADSANRAKSEFISFVAHELRTPMTSIRGYTELMRKGVAGEVNENQASFLDIIAANTERLSTLVGDLADISRIESGNLRMEMEQVELSEVVQQVYVSIQQQVSAKKQTLDVRVPEGLPALRGDRARLVQILSNLVSNAYKYTPDGGQITLRAELAQPDGIHISVQDSGIGISPEDQEKIFTKFFRSPDAEARRAPGTGLGLSITKHLVELHGGKIWFESAFRKGTTFHILLPLNPTSGV